MFPGLSLLLLTLDEIDLAEETSGCIDLDVASYNDHVMDADGLTLSHILRIDS